MTLVLVPCPRLPTHRTALPPAVAARLYWLGQAGFLIETQQLRVLIDPYLSDSLAEKYRGKENEHRRMVPVPLEPSQLKDIDLYLCTHGHSDHLDPGTIGPVAAANPDCLFVVPAAWEALAIQRRVPPDRLRTADAFQSLSVKGLSVFPLPSAHETLEIDASGHHKFLGYILDFGCMVLYHSGDCVPYEGLVENLSKRRIDLALLPINGRDTKRSLSGIPGNFHLREAVDLALAAKFRSIIGHHFGLFDFNTIDPVGAQGDLDHWGFKDFHLARSNVSFELMKS